MWAEKNWNAMGSSFYGIVSALGHQAAAYKGNGGKMIAGGKFADSIQD